MASLKPYIRAGTLYFRERSPQLIAVASLKPDLDDVARRTHAEISTANRCGLVEAARHDRPHRPRYRSPQLIAVASLKRDIDSRNKKPTRRSPQLIAVASLKHGFVLLTDIGSEGRSPQLIAVASLKLRDCDVSGALPADLHS